MSYPNPCSILIPPDSQVSVTCGSNVNLLQRVTLLLNGKPGAVFTGQGVGVPLTTANGDQSYQGATRQAFTMTAQFEVSSDGVNYTNATVEQYSNAGIVVVVGAQDSSQGTPMDTFLVTNIQSL